MAATSPAFAAVAQCDEAPSTSCSEQVVPSHEASLRSCGHWKVAMVAATVGLIATAGTSWTWKVAAGEEVTGLDATASYHAHPSVGCSNWQAIQFSSTVVADKSACATTCSADALCTSFNWQAAACGEGSDGMSPNTCIIFHGACDTGRNYCWEMNYKASATSTTGKTVTQTLTVDVSGSSAAVGESVKSALAAQSPTLPPSTVTVTEGSTSRRLAGGRRLFFGSVTVKIEWKCGAADGTKRIAEDFAKSLVNSAETVSKFVTKCKEFLPSGTSLTSDTIKATLPVTTSPATSTTEASTTTDASGATAGDAAEKQPAGKTVTQSLTFQDVDGKSQDVADAVKDALAAQDAALPTSTITVTEGEALDGKGSVTVKIVWECGADAAKKGIAEGFANGLVDSADTMATFVTGFKDKLPSGTSLTSGTVTATSPETTDLVGS